MAVLKIDNFGGLVPRVSPRHLPPTAAQTNTNLLATAAEFRPLQQHGSQLTVPAVAGVKTLYRTQRNGDTNQLHANVVDGWRQDVAHKDYVRGQLNDDATERTYYSMADGSVPARVFNNKPPSGEDWLLGVPAPSDKPVLSVRSSTKMKLDAAISWRDSTLIPQVSNIVKARMLRDGVSSRYDTELRNESYNAHRKSVAGVTVKINNQHATNANGIVYPGIRTVDGLSIRGHHEPWNLLCAAPFGGTYPEGLQNPLLGGVKVDELVWYGCPAFPSWGILDDVNLRRDLADKVKNPAKPSEPLWTAWEVDWMARTLQTITGPGNPKVASLRQQIDAAVQAYFTAAFDVFALGAKPTTKLVTGTGASAVTETDAAFNSRVTGWVDASADGVSAMMSAHARALEIGLAIEATYDDAFKNFETIFGDWLKANLPIAQTDANPYGLVPIDSESEDTRFYITTYVTEWGEESAPSAPSDQLTLSYNDVVVVKAPPHTALNAEGRNIKSWRLYRSNAGSQSAAFQFVEERKYTEGTSTRPAFNIQANVVGIPVNGTGDPNRWRDTIATWAVYNKIDPVKYLYNGSNSDIGRFLDTNLLVIGDTVTQTNYDGVSTFAASASAVAFHGGTLLEYRVTKQWNGSAWVATQVPSVGDDLTTPAMYVDGKSGAQLGEVCPSTTWEVPPYRMDTAEAHKDKRHKPTKGVNPYTRGLTGMANGVMAGFVDNFVAFCEPYVPYAWPVEYQIPLEFPIVGLCAFGQSMVVGTMANPYIISGADSASMSAIKLNNSQACVSARSMVAADGGVFYASPDGYCFASGRGVEVITADLFAREDWQKLEPHTIFAAMHDNVLYFWYEGTGGGCYSLDFSAKKLTMQSMRAGAASGSDSRLLVSAVFEDVVTDKLYAATGSGIVPLFSLTSHQQGTWRSPVMTLPEHQPMAWVRVLASWEAPGPVTVKWFGGGVLRHTATLTNNEAQRLPAGRFLEHEIEVTSQQRVTHVMLASSSAELRGV